MILGKYLECMQRQDQMELLPFDPKPERTLRRLCRESQVTQPEIMQHQVDARQIHDRDEPRVKQNGHNHRNPSTTPFVQPDNPHMLLEEFALPPTVVQSAICRPLIQANNFELKGVTLQMLNNIQFHRLPSENPNAHLTNLLNFVIQSSIME